MPDIVVDGYLRQVATHKREGSELYSKTAVGDDSGLSISISPPAYVACILQGFSTGSGTVTITGTDENDAAASVTHTFSRNERRWGVNQKFKTITRVQTSGLTNESTVGTVSLESISRTGQPQEITATLGNLQCRVSQMREGEILQVTGNVELESGKIFLMPAADVRRNDLLVVGGNTWEVKAIKTNFNRRGTKGFKTAIVFAEGQN